MERPDPALAAALARAAAQHGAITRGQALCAGLSPARLLTLTRSGGWAHPVRGAYVVPGSGPNGLARAALLVRPEGVLCGITAARLHRLPDVTSARHGDVHVLLPRALRHTRRRGMITHWSSARYEIVDVDGLPATTLERTLADCLLWSPRDEAVALLDAALRAARISPAYLPTLRADVARRYGGAARSAWCALVDARAESPLETRLRLVIGDAGLGPEAVQHPVWDGGRLVARLDFAWPSAMLAVEADGLGPHEAPAALLRDRRRQNELVGLGWHVLRFTWADVVRRSGYVCALVAGHLGACG